MMMSHDMCNTMAGRTTCAIQWPDEQHVQYNGRMNNMSNTMAGRIPVAARHNLLDNYHKIQVSSVDKQPLVVIRVSTCQITDIRNFIKKTSVATLLFYYPRFFTINALHGAFTGNKIIIYMSYSIMTNDYIN